MIPQTRTDLFLAKITGEDVTLPVPQTRFELYLANIAGESYELPAPNSRATLYLAKILGQDVELPEPQTRSELYLASIAGMSVQLPEAPQTREEWYLARWAEDAGYVVISGNPVTFNAVAAKLRQLKIAFSPVQSLNGYDAPWPAGGGKNLVNFAVKSDEVQGITYSKNSDGSVTVAGTSTGIAAFPICDIPIKADVPYRLTGCPQGGGVNKWALYANDTNPQLFDGGSGSTQTQPSDTIAKIYFIVYPSISVNFTFFPMLRVKKDGDNDTFAPYSNICPISGWSSLTVEQRGKNLFPYADYPVYTYNWAIKQTFADAGRPILLKAGVTYTVSIPSGVKLYRFRFFDINKNVIDPTGKYTTFTSGASTSVTFYSSYYFCGYQNALGSNNVTVIEFNEDVYMDAVMESEAASPVQIEIGSTASPYQPYNPSSRSISISFGSTVYSGWVDVISGVGEVTHGIVDLGTLDWTYYEYAGNSGGYSSGIWEKAKPNQASLVPNSVCTELYPLSDIDFNSYNTGHCFAINQNGTIKLTYPNVTDAQTLKSALSGVMLCYELATPIPIQLTPQEVESLAGDNTMWSDANGDLTVEYWKDGNVSDAEALSLLLGGRYTPAQGPEDVPDREALRIITGR